MTAEDFIDHLARLIADGRDAEALALASQQRQAMLPLLSPEQFLHVCSMMEGAQLAADMLAVEAGQGLATEEQPAAVEQPARPAS